MKKGIPVDAKAIYLYPLLCLMLLLGGVRVLSQETAPRGPSDPAELEAFLDDLMARQMEEHHIPGAAVSVVKDGKLFFSRGYGYEDSACL